MNLANCREEWDFDLAIPRGSETREEAAGYQIARTSADADVQTQLHCLTHNLQKIAGFLLRRQRSDRPV